jgi:hypothetical protein
MPETNVPACPTHGARPRSLHSESFEGIVLVIEELIGTVSGVGTISYSRCPYGYPFNFEGVVRALEDLNTSISGISGGGGGSASGIAAGSGIYITQSGDIQIINATITSASGLTITAGSGIYLSDAGTRINLNAVGDGSVTVLYSGTVAVISGTDTQGGGGGGGASVTVSGSPGTGYSTGDLWYDTNEGRLFVYASGGSVSDPSWYQTNAEAVALKSEAPPSGTGENAPPRDGSLWFNTLMGSLFVYDTATSGWYEAGPERSFAYGAAAPAPSTEGAGWYSTVDSNLKVWNGSAWVTV